MLLKKIDLESILNGNINLINEVNMYEPSDANIEVVILPIHVKNILLAYLEGKINQDEIILWGKFLCIRSGEYTCQNWEEDESADFYEDMWYVVQKLSTPEIDGEITAELLGSILKSLINIFRN
jgi:hypothetical protein